MQLSVDVGGFRVEVDVTHFNPGSPVRWGSTPEDSDEGEAAEVSFDILSALASEDVPDDSDLPSRDSIEEAIFTHLH